jgi:nicotinate-nucleotide adenylyltransferase
MKIALFGTSADPPTVAHQQIIAHLATEFDRVLVWAAENPFKQHGANLDQRAKMLELLVGEIETELGAKITVDRQLAYRHTLDTVKVAESVYPNAQFILAIGADLIPQLSHWYRVQELLDQVDLIVFPREGQAIDRQAIASLTQLGAKIRIDRFLPFPVSSTEIRAGKKPIGLTPLVAAYIHEYQLYQTN